MLSLTTMNLHSFAWASTKNAQTLPHTIAAAAVQLCYILVPKNINDLASLSIQLLHNGKKLIEVS